MASGGDGRAVRSWQARMKASGSLEIPADVRHWIYRRVRTVAVGDDETLATIRSVHEASGGLCVLDPHTAVGVAAAMRSPFADAPPSTSTAISAAFATDPSTAIATICLGCAHAVKFLPAVATALRIDMARALDTLPDLSTHPCVRAVGDMARHLQLTTVSEAQLASPPGCTTVLRRGEDWEARLRELLESIAKPPMLASKL